MPAVESSRLPATRLTGLGATAHFHRVTESHPFPGVGQMCRIEAHHALLLVPPDDRFLFRPLSLSLISPRPRSCRVAAKLDRSYDDYSAERFQGSSGPQIEGM